jgi:hypothetical protein
MDDFSGGGRGRGLRAGPPVPLPRIFLLTTDIRTIPGVPSMSARTEGSVQRCAARSDGIGGKGRAGQEARPLPIRHTSHLGYIHRVDRREEIRDQIPAITTIGSGKELTSIGADVHAAGILSIGTHAVTKHPEAHTFAGR